MKIFIIIITIIIGISGVAYVALGDSPSPEKVSTNQKVSDPNTISIKNFAFAKKTITIKKGTTITWVNDDDAHHDITPTSGAADFVASKLLANGETYKFTFDTVGTYTYKCSPHPYMKGSIEVTE